MFATYLLFAFHSATVYDVHPFYHVKNAQLSNQLGIFTLFGHHWHMPLFFLLAGWSTHAALERRSATEVRHVFTSTGTGRLLL